MLSFDTYSRVNKPERTSLVFRLGIDAGFFSEFNNMILAMAWCIENGIQFKLYSRNAWFSNEGWSTFFQPIVKESKWQIHDKINNRTGAPLNKKHRYLFRNFYRLLYPNHLLTYESWRFFRNQEWEEYSYNIPKINFQGNLSALCQNLAEMVWRYNEETDKYIQELFREIGNGIHEPYVGFHIRGGDKFKEDQLYPFGRYLEEMSKHTELKKAFVLTDDYQAFAQAKKAYPEWEFSTLCEEDEKGYYHQEFMKMPKEYIRRKTLRLFASVDILKKAEYFMGTFSSNPGMFLGMRMEPERCLSVDGSQWRIW